MAALAQTASISSPRNGLVATGAAPASVATGLTGAPRNRIAPLLGDPPLVRVRAAIPRNGSSGTGAFIQPVSRGVPAPRVSVLAVAAAIPAGSSPVVAYVGGSTPSIDLRTWFHVSGIFRDGNGIPGKRRIHAYSRVSGKLTATTDSDPVTGAYRLSMPTGEEVKVTCQDDEAAPIQNDLILRTIPLAGY